MRSPHSYVLGVRAQLVAQASLLFLPRAARAVVGAPEEARDHQRALVGSHPRKDLGRVKARDIGNLLGPGEAVVAEAGIHVYRQGIEFGRNGTRRVGERRDSVPTHNAAIALVSPDEQSTGVGPAHAKTSGHGGKGGRHARRVVAADLIAQERRLDGARSDLSHRSSRG